jgi:hypothetical protein
MAAFKALGTATCLCALLMTLQFALATAQRQHTATRLAQQVGTATCQK